MAYGIPVIGWIIGVFYSVSISIPFYFIWNGMAPKYFYFLPELYLDLPFWDCVGLFILSSMLKALLVPKFVSVSQSNESKSSK